MTLILCFFFEFSVVFHDVAMWRVFGVAFACSVRPEHLPVLRQSFFAIDMLTLAFPRFGVPTPGMFSFKPSSVFRARFFGSKFRYADLHP